MSPVWRIVGIAGAFVVTCIGWLVLGGVTSVRSSASTRDLRGDVADLWGRPQSQQAPSFQHSWVTERDATRTETVGGEVRTVRERVAERHDRAVSPTATRVRADLHLDRRRRGLVWYALYDVRFEGAWTYVHREPEAGTLSFRFSFPDAQALYDGFELRVNGDDRARELRPDAGSVATEVPVRPGETVEIRVAYTSRGMDTWHYAPTDSVGNLEDFSLRLTTDFPDIDFPASTMSPSTKTPTAGGWELEWTFARALTGRSIGMILPSHVQPGELAASLAFSAPISLFFFFLVLFVLATIRGLDIHPINYFLLGAAFLCFHLLFAYSVDHVSIEVAFALASAVSVLLVVSYLRLVVSARFAFVEAGLAQLVYLVGFSLAHFWEGWTGLSVTVLSVVTVFVLMQLTGRIRWSEVLARRPSGGTGRVAGAPIADGIS
jgi:hypothetical protein